MMRGLAGRPVSVVGPSEAAPACGGIASAQLDI